MPAPTRRLTRAAGGRDLPAVRCPPKGPTEPEDSLAADSEQTDIRPKSGPVPLVLALVACLPGMLPRPGRAVPSRAPRAGPAAAGPDLRGGGDRGGVRARLGGRGGPARRVGQPGHRRPGPDRGPARVRDRLRVRLEGRQRRRRARFGLRGARRDHQQLRAGPGQHDRGQPAADRHRLVDDRVHRLLAVAASGASATMASPWSAPRRWSWPTSRWPAPTA